MNGKVFEGSVVLEKLAEQNLLDDFYEAIDMDDFKKAHELMCHIGVGAETISRILRQMRESNGAQ